MDGLSVFRVSLVILILLILGLEPSAKGSDDDYIWVVKDPEIQDNIPPSRRDEYRAERDRAEAQETLEAIEAEVRRGVDQRD